MPHYDALVLTLYISGFDVHKILVDPGSAANLLQHTRLQPDEAFLTNVKLSRASLLWFQRHNNHDTVRHHNSCTSRTSHPAGFVLSRPRPGALQLHTKPGLAELDEGRPFNVSPNSQLFDQCGAG